MSEVVDPSHAKAGDSTRRLSFESCISESGDECDLGEQDTEVAPSCNSQSTDAFDAAKQVATVVQGDLAPSAQRENSDVAGLVRGTGPHAYSFSQTRSATTPTDAKPLAGVSLSAERDQSLISFEDMGAAATHTLKKMSSSDLRLLGDVLNGSLADEHACETNVPAQTENNATKSQTCSPTQTRAGMETARPLSAAFNMADADNVPFHSRQSSSSSFRNLFEQIMSVGSVSSDGANNSEDASKIPTSSPERKRTMADSVASGSLSLVRSSSGSFRKMMGQVSSKVRSGMAAASQSAQPKQHSDPATRPPNASPSPVSAPARPSLPVSSASSSSSLVCGSFDHAPSGADSAPPAPPPQPPAHPSTTPSPAHPSASPSPMLPPHDPRASPLPRAASSAGSRSPLSLRTASPGPSENFFPSAEPPPSLPPTPFLTPAPSLCFPTPPPSASSLAPSAALLLQPPSSGFSAAPPLLAEDGYQADASAATSARSLPGSLPHAARWDSPCAFPTHDIAPLSPPLQTPSLSGDDDLPDCPTPALCPLAAADAPPAPVEGEQGALPWSVAPAEETAAVAEHGGPPSPESIQVQAPPRGGHATEPHSEPRAGAGLPVKGGMRWVTLAVGLLMLLACTAAFLALHPRPRGARSPAQGRAPAVQVAPAGPGATARVPVSRRVESEHLEVGAGGVRKPAGVPPVLPLEARERRAGPVAAQPLQLGRGGEGSDKGAQRRGEQTGGGGGEREERRGSTGGEGAEERERAMQAARGGAGAEVEVEEECAVRPTVRSRYALLNWLRVAAGSVPLQARTVPFA